MAEYKHGVYVSEAATDLLSMSRQSAGVTYAVGISPIASAQAPAAPNVPILCSTYNEAVNQLGYSTDTSTYGLCEAMEVLFGLYQVGPIVFVNVLDPSRHKTTTTRTQKLVTANHTVELTGSIVRSTLKVETKTMDGSDEIYTEIEGITIEGGETLTIKLPTTYSMGAQVYVSYDETNAAAVTVDDIEKGIELVSEVYPRFGLTVGLMIAPGWSHNPTVAMKLAAAASNINGHFSAVGICDLDSNAIADYTQAAAWKNSNGLSREHLITCYPNVKYGTKVQSLSTHAAGLSARLAADSDDIPYQSPSNKAIYISGMCKRNGSDCYFGQEAANDSLNLNGIVTVLQFDGWKLWGNRIACYPSNTDPKDCWISVRRMFDFIKRALVLNFWSQVDEPIMKRQIESLVNSANTYLNGLVSRGAIVGGRVEFRSEENPITDLADGIVRLRCFFTPAPPCRALEFTLQFDGEYLSELY